VQEPVEEQVLIDEEEPVKGKSLEEPVEEQVLT
jgi:hypothetical protein